jgi:hypothetical protein
MAMEKFVQKYVLQFWSREKTRAVPNQDSQEYATCVYGHWKEFC